MLNTLLIALFFLSASLVIYHHFGYPLLLRWYARNETVRQFNTPLRYYQPSRADRARATITIIVPPTMNNTGLPIKFATLPVSTIHVSAIT